LFKVGQRRLKVAGGPHWNIYGNAFEGSDEVAVARVARVGE
jgi:hypothetical protein